MLFKLILEKEAGIELLKPKRTETFTQSVVLSFIGNPYTTKFYITTFESFPLLILLWEN
jgi:hypothetical protein